MIMNEEKGKNTVKIGKNERSAKVGKVENLNVPKVRVTETALRDAHQSLMATRMRIEDMLPVAEMMDEIGYHSLEVWCGATFVS